MDTLMRQIMPEDYDFIYNVFTSYRPNVFGYYTDRVYRECIKMLIENDGISSVTTVGLYKDMPKSFIIAIIDCQAFIKQLNKAVSFIDKIKMQLSSYQNQTSKSELKVDKQIQEWYQNIYYNYNKSAYILMKYKDADIGKAIMMEEVMVANYRKLKELDMHYTMGQVKKDNMKSLISAKMKHANIYDMNDVYLTIYDIEQVLQRADNK